MHFFYRDLGLADDLNYVSVSRVKYLMELHGKKCEAEHSKEKSGFPDIEFDGKKSTTAIGNNVEMRNNTKLN